MASKHKTSDSGKCEMPTRSHKISHHHKKKGKWSVVLLRILERWQSCKYIAIMVLLLTIVNLCVNFIIKYVFNIYVYLYIYICIYR